MVKLNGLRVFLLLLTPGFSNSFLVPDASQNASISALYTVFKSEIAKLNSQLANFRIDFANIKLDDERLKGTFSGLASGYADIDSALENTTQENKILQKGIDDLKIGITKAEQDRAALVTEFTTLRQEFNSLGDRYRELIESYENLTISRSPDLAGNHSNNPSIKGPTVAFSVSKPDGTYGRDGGLNFTQAEYNDGGAYNFTSGQFECSVPGLYFFSASLVREPGGYPESFCYLTINGFAKAYLGGYGYNATVGHPTGTATMVYHMDKGDTAYVGICGVIDQIGYYSNFNGFLIDAD